MSEQSALYDGVNDIAEAEFRVARLGEDLIDDFTVGKLYFASSGKHHELNDYVSCERFVLVEQNLLEVHDVGKLPATCGNAACVHRFALLGHLRRHDLRNLRNDPDQLMTLFF